MKTSYNFRRLLDKAEVHKILKDTADATDSTFQLRLEVVTKYRPRSAPGTYDYLEINSIAKADGNFRKKIDSIDFVLSTCTDNNNIAHFSEIKFSQLDLQEFGESGRLKKYTNSLIDAIKESYKNL